MITTAIIDEALKLDAEESANPRGRIAYDNNPFIAHAANNYAAICRRVRELEAEVARLKLLRYSPIGDNHHNANDCPYCSGVQDG